jgi:WhiB family redox-sensing transcriptional regulator
MLTDWNYDSLTLTEQPLQRRDAAEPKAAILICEPPNPMTDPAFGANVEDLPCQVLDADLWFAETPAELEQAKAHCRECPLMAGCLAGALERREPWGVWGGEIFNQGEVIAQKRPRGRPRKNPIEVAA